jgi:tRNA (guanine-N7-)-methyltransferase
MTDLSEARTDRHRAFLEVRQERISMIRAEMDAAFPSDEPIVLEIGCGHGHFLVAYSEQHPAARCLGIDLVSKRIRKALSKRDKRKLASTHFLKAEIREVMEAWPERLKLERVFILFPDPWPKKRHIKNRIIQASLLDELSRHSIAGTALHFRTDDQANFDWGRDTILGHPRWVGDDEADWPFENPSFFQDLFTEYFSLTAQFQPAGGE